MGGAEFMKTYNIDKWHDVCVFYSLDEFINVIKSNYPTKRQIKLNIDDYPFTFDNVYRDMINLCLHKLNVTKTDKLTIHVYDDAIMIYTNNKCYMIT